jgi:hypothetical protein
VEFVEHSQLLKFECLQNKVLHTTGNLPRPKPTCDLRVVFKIPYLHDFITKLCREKAKVTLNHENVRNPGQGEAKHTKYKSLKLGGG